MTESNAPAGPVAWVLTRDDLLMMVEQIRSCVVVVMDHETTGLDEHAVTGGLSNGGVGARVAMTSLTLPQRGADGEWDGEEPTTWIVPLSHPQSPWLGEWRKVLRLIGRAMVKYGKPLVNHHAKFDARWSKATTGVDIAHLISWDTQSSSHLLDETQSTKLKEVVPREFGVERWDDHDLSTPGAAERVDLWELGEYAARDTYWVWRLYLLHLQRLFLTGDPFDMPIGPDEIAEARLGRVATRVTAPTARALGHMEQAGLMLDVDYTREHLEDRREIAGTKLIELADYYGLDRRTASAAATSGWFKNLTEIAVEKGDLVVSSRTPNGNPQWNKHVLRKQASRGSDLAKIILEQRDASKQAEFLSSWLEKVTPEGFIHSTYRAGHVTTGRLSSASPNMQQISKKLKPAFLPRPGNVLAEIDYSQLELRVAAFISRCVPMIEAFNDDQDLHTLFAADLMTKRARVLDPGAAAVSLLDVPAEERQKAKSGNFGLLYLQEAAGFRNYADAVYGVDMTLEEAAEVYDGFFETWTGMHEWHESVKKDAARRGYVTSPIGRIRKLPNIHSYSEYLRGEAERQAVNAPVQGFGSDLMQMAIASIMGILPGTTAVPNALPVATVHDSVLVEVPEDDWETPVRECQERMIHLEEHLRFLEVEMDVPLKAEAEVGTRWGLSDVGIIE